MVNFGLNSASILGIFLAVAGASLYFLRSVRPELSRDQDIFFAAVGLLCGLILLFQGWRLDPILQFGQFLLTGSTIFFAVEAIRMRGLATEQARRNTPIVDDERPVSRVYRAELDQIEPYETDEQYDNPRLRGYQDSRSTRRSGYESNLRSSSRTRKTSDRYGSSSKRKRRPRPASPPPSNSYEEYTQWQETPDHWQEQQPYSSRSSRPRPESTPETHSRPSRIPRRSPRDEPIAREPNMEPTPTDYVDYHPIDSQDNQEHNRNGDWDQEETRSDNQERDNPINFDY